MDKHDELSKRVGEALEDPKPIEMKSDKKPKKAHKSGSYSPAAIEMATKKLG